MVTGFLLGKAQRFFTETLLRTAVWAEPLLVTRDVGGSIDLIGILNTVFIHIRLDILDASR